jgi:hypothetical protein
MDGIIDSMFDGYMSNSSTNIQTEGKKINDGMIYSFFVNDMLYSTMEILME